MTTTSPSSLRNRKRRHAKANEPDPKRERAIGYYRHAGDLFERHFGRRPSRTTLYKYLVNGYPVERGGPKVRLPVYYALKRPMTTVEAMARFLTEVRHLERRLR